MLNTPTFAASVSAALVIGMAIVFFIRSYINDLSAASRLSDISVKMAVMRATQGTSRTLLAIDSFASFLGVYAKPLLASLTDLQSALHLQVTDAYLYRTTREHVSSGRNGGTTDGMWPCYLFAFGMAELCAWLEAFRTLQNSTVDNASEHLEDVLAVVEDIRRVMSGNSDITAELQALGNVMLVFKTDESTQLSVRVPLSIDEFLRVVSAKAPDSEAPYQLQYNWAQSFDNKLQVVCSPLLEEVTTLSQQPPDKAPKKRLALLQVLLCKLIDLMDPSVPWDMGPAFDPGEPRRLVLRDDRLTPLVSHLSPAQIEWLRERPYFRNDTNISFPGFRTDLSHLTQEERDQYTGLWPGACPPCEPRRRPPQWRRERQAAGATQLPHAAAAAPILHTHAALGQHTAQQPVPKVSSLKQTSGRFQLGGGGGSWGRRMGGGDAGAGELTAAPSGAGLGGAGAGKGFLSGSMKLGSVRVAPSAN